MDGHPHRLALLALYRQAATAKATLIVGYIHPLALAVARILLHYV